MTIDELAKRKSAHSFNDREVEPETINEVLDAARQAPSAWNLQPWRFLVLRSDSAVEAAVESSYGQDWMGEAARIVAILGDMRISTHAEEALDDTVAKGYKTREEADSSLDHIEDYGDRSEQWRRNWLNRNCMFAAAYMLLAAEEEGLSTCPVRGFDQEEISGTLDLDEHWLPLLLVPIGYSDEYHDRKYRRDLSEMTRRV